MVIGGSKIRRDEFYQSVYRHIPSITTFVHSRLVTSLSATIQIAHSRKLTSWNFLGFTVPYPPLENSHVSVSS